MSLIDELAEANGEHTGEIAYAGITIVPGDEVAHTSLVYDTQGNWCISMYYGYRYNGPDVEIGEYQARDVLLNLTDHGVRDDFSDTDIFEYDWAYMECDECPHDDGGD